MSAREKLTGLNSIKFNKRFKDDIDCYEYLSLIKWEDGFVLENVITTNITKLKSHFNEGV